MTNEQKWKSWDNSFNTVAFIIAILLIIPLAPLVNRYIPPIILGGFNLDIIIAFTITILVIFMLLRFAKIVVGICFILLLFIFTINQFSENRYGFSDVFNDYKSLVVQNWGNKGAKLIDLELLPSYNDNPYSRIARRLSTKVDYKDSLVRNYAVERSLEFFDEYHAKFGPIVRQLSLFKAINSRFKYVHDSQRDEYFASPRETILNGLGGDCDDHTILMVSTMKAIGARTRMVLTEGHVYPELYCGDKKGFDRMKEAIELLFANVISGQLFYHEENGEYWINLDYSARHPGGPYSNPKAYAIIED